MEWVNLPKDFCLLPVSLWDSSLGCGSFFHTAPQRESVLNKQYNVLSGNIFFLYLLVQWWGIKPASFEIYLKCLGQYSYWLTWHSSSTKYVELYFPLKASRSLQITCNLFVCNLISGQVMNLYLVQLSSYCKSGNYILMRFLYFWDKMWSPPRHLFLFCQILSMLYLPKDVPPLVLLVLVNDVDMNSVI